MFLQGISINFFDLYELTHPRSSFRTRSCQERTLSDGLQPEYMEMHNSARYVIHSSEVLAMAIETTTSMMQEHHVSFEENGTLHETAPIMSRQIKRHLQLHRTVSKCLYLWLRQDPVSAYQGMIQNIDAIKTRSQAVHLYCDALNAIIAR